MPRAPLTGGAETMLRQFIARGTRLRWTIAVLENGPPVDELRVLGARVVVVEDASSASAGEDRLLDRLRESGTEDAVGVMSWIDAAHPSGSKLARALNIPVVLFQHHMPDPANERDVTVAALPTDLVLASSEAIAGACRRLSPGVQVEVIYPGVDLELAREQLATPQQRVGPLGSLDRGLEFLRDATRNPRYSTHVRLGPGDLLMFRNDWISHGRTAYKDTPLGRRHLVRALYCRPPRLP